VCHSHRIKLLYGVNYVQNTTASFLLLAAILQWVGIGERIQHALWQWFKFKDYSGGGYTTVSSTSFIVVSGLTAILVVIAIVLTRSNTSKFANVVVKISLASFITGISCLYILVLSPLGEVR
jgi:hypothetical protein